MAKTEYAKNTIRANAYSFTIIGPNVKGAVTGLHVRESDENDKNDTTDVRITINSIATETDHRSPKIDHTQH
jgi:hypothetical protein